jgi:S1-C subfamily serine protease
MEVPRFARQVVTALLTFLLVFGTLGTAGLVSRAAAQEQGEMSKVEVVERVGPAVVTVYNLTTAPSLFGQQAEAQVQGAGTGFIISEEGYIVTNWHVVDGGDAFQVILQDGTPVEAELIGIDARDDLAVVKIAPENVPAVVSFGDSDAVQPGQEVLAIGSPLGAFANTVTAGIISGTGRNQLAPQEATMCQDYSNLIQHDAAINHGNSGGPLFNLRGEVIGVNTLGIPTDASGQPVQGIFFAVPSNTVETMVTQLIEDGSISRAYLGVTFYELSPQMANQYELPVDFGALVSEIESGSPAEQSGLQRNDIIVGVNGQEISADRTFTDVMLGIPGNTEATFTVLREGQTQDIQVLLGESEVDFSECSLQPQLP